jgi:exonuclease SbcC
MRPVRLRLQGFTAFRSMPAPIDFSDVDLFALTGPTGSGKSSIVDAICFALYGSVPRLDKGRVEPVISLGAQEARILFEFTVDGVPYTVARVVKRQPRGGAVQAEATLEGGAEAVSGADQVTEAVERLLGLPFEDFTRSVVLPQGDFAKFLHDKPAGRQDLLRRLLDLGVYERMRSIAQNRKGPLEAQAALLESQVGELGRVEPGELDIARARSGAIGELLREIESALPHLDALSTAAAEAARSVAAADARIDAVTRLRRPAGVERLAAVTADAAAAVDAARSEVAAAAEAAAESEVALTSAGDAGWLTETARLHDRLAELRQRRGRGADLIGASEQELAVAQDAARRRRSELVEAVEAERVVRTAHAAHAIRAELADGDLCPVCGQVVAVLGDVETPAALSDAEARRVKAEEDDRRASAEVERLGGLLVAYRDRLEEVDGELASVTGELAGRPEPAAVRESLSALEAARQAVKAARTREQASRAKLEKAVAASEGARSAEAGAWEELDRARDSVAELGPPPVQRVDLVAAWDTFSTWCGAVTERLDTERAGARAEAEKAAGARAGLVAGFVDRAVALEIPTGGDSFHRDVIEASLMATAQVERLEERVRRSAELAESATDHRRRADIAGALARHLAANGFQAWILEEAFLGLVASANVMLSQLSQGAYSLHVDRRDFVVVDHRNADETRSVRTLSGGETFLVSLSLALALAEQLSMVGGSGGARLESIFLDEGFGTLDSETLETVSAVIQELGATGRTVGIITHVTELAEQVPVRFEVRKLPGGSVVTRVES